MPVIGFLNGGSPGGYASNVNAFHQGLKEAGYTDGQNVTIAYRWANDELDRLPSAPGLGTSAWPHEGSDTIPRRNPLFEPVLNDRTIP
jgi:hypothetical protein